MIDKDNVLLLECSNLREEILKKTYDVCENCRWYHEWEGGTRVSPDDEIYCTKYPLANPRNIEDAEIIHQCRKSMNFEPIYSTKINDVIIAEDKVEYLNKKIKVLLEKRKNDNRK